MGPRSAGSGGGPARSLVQTPAIGGLPLERSLRWSFLWELRRPRHRGPATEEEMLASDDGVIEEHVVATKLTGDPNVPAGRVTFRANISRRKRVSFSSSAMQSWQMHKESPPGGAGSGICPWPRPDRGRGSQTRGGSTGSCWCSIRGARSDGAPLAFVFCMEEPPVDFVGEGAREVPAEMRRPEGRDLAAQADLTRKKEAAGRA